MQTAKRLCLLLCVVLALSSCSSNGAQNDADAAAAYQAQIDTLNGKLDQLQQKIDALDIENEQLKNDATSSTVDDLKFILDQISQSDSTLESFPALISGMDASGDGFVLHLDRLDYNPGFTPGSAGSEPYLVNKEIIAENVIADRFTYLYYGGFLIPETDESFKEYISGFDSGVQFTIYMQKGHAVFLDEVTVP